MTLCLALVVSAVVSFGVRFLSSTPIPVFSWVDIAVVTIAYGVSTLFVEHGRLPISTLSLLISDLRLLIYDAVLSFWHRRDLDHDIAFAWKLLAGRRVLVLDDTPALRASVHAALSTCEVLQLAVDRENPERVRLNIKRANPDLILVGVEMSDDLRHQVVEGVVPEAGVILVEHRPREVYFEPFDVWSSPSGELARAAAFLLNTVVGRKRPKASPFVSLGG